MFDRQPDENPDIQDDAIKISVELDEEVQTEGLSCAIYLEDGRAVIRCATFEDIERAKAALSSPVRIELDVSAENIEDGDDITAEEDLEEDD